MLARETIYNSERVSFSTDSVGEDALVIDKLDENFGKFEIFFENDDISTMYVEMDLSCLGIDYKEYVLKGEATLSFHISRFFDCADGWTTAFLDSRCPAA